MSLKRNEERTQKIGIHRKSTYVNLPFRKAIITDIMNYCFSSAIHKTFHAEKLQVRIISKPVLYLRSSDAAPDCAASCCLYYFIYYFKTIYVGCTIRCLS